MADTIEGVITALVTPFTLSGQVDEEAVRRLVRRQLEGGVTGIAAAASTGEGAALEPEEHATVVRSVVEEVERGDDDALVAAGIGLSSTDAACRLGRRAADNGADALLVSAPPYNKPPQRGIGEHFWAVAEAVDLPVILYNVPSRTAVEVSAETILELAQEPSFVAVKEASGDLGQVSRIIAGRPPDFAVLSGDDLLTVPIVALGGDGVVAVISNQFPKLLVELVKAAREGRRSEASALHARLLPLMEANFVESNPIPVKWTLAQAGLIDGCLRPPLTPLDERHEDVIERALNSVTVGQDPGGEAG